MTDFIKFRTLAEYARWEETRQTAVQAALADEQKAITWGDKFVRVWREPAILDSRLLAIFGDIYSWETLERAGDGDELAMLKLQESRFLYAQCFSVIEPKGEPGSVNRWDIWPITDNQFRLAEIAGWNPTHSTVWPWFREKVREMASKRGRIPEPPPGSRL
jgi:hypothetical protein